MQPVRGNLNGQPLPQNLFRLPFDSWITFVRYAPRLLNQRHVLLCFFDLLLLLLLRPPACAHELSVAAGNSQQPYADNLDHCPAFTDHFSYLAGTIIVQARYARAPSVRVVADFDITALVRAPTHCDCRSIRAQSCYKNAISRLITNKSNS